MKSQNCEYIDKSGPPHTLVTGIGEQNVRQLRSLQCALLLPPDLNELQQVNPVNKCRLRTINSYLAVHQRQHAGGL